MFSLADVMKIRPVMVQLTSPIVPLPHSQAKWTTPLNIEYVYLVKMRPLETEAGNRKNPSFYIRQHTVDSEVNIMDTRHMIRSEDLDGNLLYVNPRYVEKIEPHILVWARCDSYGEEDSCSDSGMVSYYADKVEIDALELGTEAYYH